MAEANTRAGSSPPEYSMTHGAYTTSYPMTPSHDMSPYETPMEGQTPPTAGTLYNLSDTVGNPIDYSQQNMSSFCSSYDIPSSWTSIYSGVCHEEYNIAHSMSRSFSPADDSPACHNNYQYLSQSCESDDSFEVLNVDKSYSKTSFEDACLQFNPGSQTCHVSPPSNQLPNFATFMEKKGPSRRGRPVTYNKPGYHFSDSDSPHSDDDDTRSVRCRRGAKNILLWKFLLNELRKPDCSHIKWEDEYNGIFKFIDTAECSRLWGMMKKKTDMNFEKLSRGIRHYYKDGLMSRRDGIRLVYQFNWHRVPKQFWPKAYRM
ncbi:Transcription factor [Mactra antiquata]